MEFSNYINTSNNKDVISNNKKFTSLSSAAFDVVQFNNNCLFYVENKAEQEYRSGRGKSWK